MRSRITGVRAPLCHVRPTSDPGRFPLTMSPNGTGAHAYSTPEDAEVGWCLSSRAYQRVYGDGEGSRPEDGNNMAHVTLVPVEFDGREFRSDATRLVLVSSPSDQLAPCVQFPSHRVVDGALDDAGKFSTHPVAVHVDLAAD